MKTCQHCDRRNPDAAIYCMACGRLLAQKPDPAPKDGIQPGGMSLFTLSILGSLVLSLILIFVFRLPIFILGAFLPFMFRWPRKRD